jgi:transcriptional regulator with XRE-family HTH domain
MKSTTINRRLIDESKSQRLLSRYLKAARAEMRLSQEELARLMRCSTNRIQKLESDKTISPVVNALDTFQEIANLRNMDVDVFVSMLLGKRNETGQPNLFLNKVARLLTLSLDTADLAELMDMLKEKQDLRGIMILARDYAESTKHQKELHKRILYVDDAGAKALLTLLDYMYSPQTKIVETQEKFETQGVSE